MQLNQLKKSIKKNNIFEIKEKDETKKQEKYENKPIKPSSNFLNLLSKFDKGKEPNNVKKHYRKKATFYKKEIPKNTLNKINEQTQQNKEAKNEGSYIPANRAKTIYLKNKIP